MRIKFALTAVFLPVLLAAQEQVSVRGRIVDEKGEPVEYVQVGVPERHIGTISTVDGQFEISVPIDTLEFFHVSYQTARYPVTGPVDNLVIVLHENELPPAVFIGGNTKEKYLVRPGKSVLKNMGSIVADLHEEGIGGELGSIATAKKPFLIQDIQFTIKSNSIPKCVASINVYRIEGEPETFVNILHKPIYFNIDIFDRPQDFDIQPDESILLEPGKYFISFQIVAVDEDLMREFRNTPESERVKAFGSYFASFPVYLKSSYIRHAAMGKMEHLPVNIGVSVKGLEYQ